MLRIKNKAIDRLKFSSQFHVTPDDGIVILHHLELTPNYYEMTQYIYIYNSLCFDDLL
jgi:hypothetical protein